MRLDKYLSDMNVGTRKELKTKIRKGVVTVDGARITDPGFSVKGDESVTFEGQPIHYHTFEYYMLNKPAGVITATEDKRQQTVIDLLGKDRRKDLFPVGRLDKNTVGLLLITNDGDLNHRLLSPKKHVDKKYYAKIDGCVTEADVDAFAKGLRIDEELTALPATLEILTFRDEATASDKEDLLTSEHPESTLSSGVTEICVTIREGKFHQIKRMFHAVGKEVFYLKRLSMGRLVLDPALAEGSWRPLTEEEIRMLNT
uniref:pseudouridine synthase n=1 Tax=Eubacterium cellulosolvens TaxID=29322 RepID=UPI00048930A5|nr:pseudouridine synthase [[Eubacterium] cellulosolvens]